MNGSAIERVFRAASGRITAALVARFRDLSLAEDAFSESCVRALSAWQETGVPDDPAAWLYRVASRVAVDMLRRQRTRRQFVPDPPPPDPTAEEVMIDDRHVIPDERLRLIFICCHPAVAPDARAALTLRLICGLTVSEISRAFLIDEATLAQRLVRAKRKIADAAVPFELPAPEYWSERLEAMLSTLEVAYSKAHEDAAGLTRHAGFAAEMLHLSTMLVDLMPDEGEAHALAALLHYAEARRPARTDARGMMVPLSLQDPALWHRELIAAADAFLVQAARLAPESARTLQAKLQACWCTRANLSEPAPWGCVRDVYDQLLRVRDDAIVRLNRVVAVAELDGADVALAELDTLDDKGLAQFGPYHAVRADLLARTGRADEARAEYQVVLALDPPPAERQWLIQRLGELSAKLQ
ncbi:RNA polymerase sigma factor [Bradyrhizobium sp. Ec3.3]|uniref:RNA polymerase sigma factor n=1 Tax=Bradyrhizobium sp. Ec3.3 TaxID=189753 RepID=UPI0003FBA8F6|nr:sigma-70 family RNA polymerase sigma factor [Bradyrhizobium sp. Ec3.3]